MRLGRDAVDATAREIVEQMRAAQQARERGLDARIQARWQLGNRRIRARLQASRECGRLLHAADQESLKCVCELRFEGRLASQISS